MENLHDRRKQILQLQFEELLALQQLIETKIELLRLDDRPVPVELVAVSEKIKLLLK